MKQQKSMTRINKFLALKDYAGEDRIVTSHEIQDDIDYAVPNICFHSKIPSLDKGIDFFEGGELVVISGPRKSGKTLLGQTLTLSFLEQDIKSLWFSYELTPRQFLRCFSLCKDLPFFLMPRKLRAHALEWIEDRIIESQVKYGIGAVFIDHLHFLFDLARTNPSIEIGQIIRFLKSLAVDLNLVIFVLCHMRKLDNPEKEPTDEDFRDSSFVSQESDTAFIIWRKRQSENKAWLKICYHRRTGIWEKKIRLVKVNGFLREVADGAGRENAEEG